VLVIGMFMSVLDTSIINVALPTVQTELGINASDGQWVSTAYSLTEGVMVPISGWLGYRFGYKKVYLVCLAAFTVASALCGLATGLVPLVGFRILQAIPGGVIPVTCMTMLRRMVPPERLGAAMGLYGLGIVVAPAVGPTLGGLLVEYFDWRFIFFVNVPVGVLGVLAAAAVLTETPGRRDRSLDVLGFATIAGGLFALLLALEEGKDWGWTSYPILILFTAAALLLALFVVIELEVDSPLLDLRVFTRSQFVLSLVLVSAVSLSMFASFFFVPQFLQSPVRGLTPVNTGLALIPQALALAVLLPLSGVLYDRFGARWSSVLGLLLAGGGALLLSRITVDIPTASLVLGTVVLAGGAGLGMMPMMSAGLTTVPAELSDSASSFSTLAQRVSQSLGLGILNAFLTSAGAQAAADRSGLAGAYASGDPRVVAMEQQGPGGLLGLYQQMSGAAETDAYGQAFLVIGLICLGGAALALLLRSGRPTPGSTPVTAH
jgi:EmrB/QacA subfamily drug resistance transporter